MGLILLALAGVFFQKFVYQGILEIKGVEPPFLVKIEDWGEEKCDTLPCKISLSPQKIKVQIEKEGYSTSVQNTEISFQSLQPLTFSLIKTPEILPYLGDIPPVLVYTPPEKNTVFTLKNFKFSGPNLFQNDRKMTDFLLPEPIGVASDEVGRGVWAFSSKQVFFVSSRTAQKQILWEGDIQSLRPNSSGSLFLQSSSGIWYFPHTLSSPVLLPPSLHPSLFSICETGENEVFGLQKTFRGTEAVIWKTDTSELNILSALGNFSDEDFWYAQCLKPHTVLFVFHTRPPLLFLF